jgi:tetratricopeptide (TPR) repeat protein
MVDAEQALKIKPNHAQSFNLKGALLARSCRYEEAIEYYEKSIGIKKNRFAPWYNKGISLKALEQYNDALECYDNAIKFYSEGCDDFRIDFCFIFKGNILSIKDLEDEAIECYDRAIKINPKNYYAFYDKGISLYKMQKYKEAKNVFKKAIKLNKKFAREWQLDGFLSKYSYHQALEQYKKSRDPNSLKFSNFVFSLGL